MGECTSTCERFDRMRDMSKGTKSIDKRHSRLLSSPNSARLKKVRSPNQGLETKKKTMTQAQMKKQLNMIFDIYDKDGDGRLSMIQLRHMFNTIYSRRSGKDLKMSEEQVLNFMKMADRGDEMSLNRQDFYHIYKNK